MITRRQLAMGTLPALTLGAIGAVGVFDGLTGYGGRAQAQTFSVLELEAKGPLDDIVMGSPTAPVTIIEYASMTCPHCAHFAAETFPKLKEKYIDTGKVRYMMREYPLDGLAAAAFMLARCAGPDKYYPMIETLFAEQPKWAAPGSNPLPPLLAIAKQAGFTEQSFQACLNDKGLLEKITQVRNRGQQKFKVASTPTFYINGELHAGAMTIEELDKAIAPLIRTTSPDAKAPDTKTPDNKTPDNKVPDAPANAPPANPPPADAPKAADTPK